ncbi:hypothetical protein HYH02_009340 [Chlamydomonas schloesseri]|uniref:Guanylate cyclase domain-containing protein n=1 Tax=Chlamydomonas schloesseri TaxID=2026947 RepID=A0A835TGE1_9CHLO|nr:hypothetical protein HYH02_009340 [Chlamydomonas schloesseri]|eukprot:KAG2443267.1 hypothetical protein HYH02_009340 [Chlamydomonas schloesseri]
MGTHGSMLLGNNELLPLRYDDIRIEHLHAWLAAGYDPREAAEFLSVYGSSLTSDNVSPDVKIRLTSNITAALLAASLRYTRRSTPESDLHAVLSDFEAVQLAVVAAESSRDAFAAQYRRSIHWTAAHATAPAPPPAAMVAEGGGGGTSWTALAAALPCAVALVVLVMIGGLAVIRWKRRQHAARHAVLGAPPGEGPQTTICVTDIADSTFLWEILPAAVMDSALRTHHTIIREAALAFEGYESSTEGDSFILAFKTSVDAAAFCLRVQQVMAWIKGADAVRRASPPVQASATMPEQG